MSPDFSKIANMERLVDKGRNEINGAMNATRVVVRGKFARLFRAADRRAVAKFRAELVRLRYRLNKQAARKGDDIDARVVQEIVRAARAVRRDIDKLVAEKFGD
jgi:hypothetical protein